MLHGITQCYLPPGRCDIFALTPAPGVSVEPIICLIIPFEQLISTLTSLKR